MSSAVPHAGSVFAYVTQGIGANAGFLAGWLAMLDYLLIPSVAYLFTGIAMHALVPVPAWVFTAAGLVITTAFNLAGVVVAARAGFLVLVAELAVFAIFVAAALAAIAAHGPARPWIAPFTGDGSLDPFSIAGAMSVAVLSYLGFDAIASFAEETTGDSRQVGSAILFCLAAAGVLFVAQTYLAGVLTSPEAAASLVAHPGLQGTAFYDLTRTAIAPWLATVLAMTKAIGPTFAAMSGQAAAARLLFGMARDGRLGRALATVDERRGVPRVSLLTTAALTLAVSVWAARRDDGLDVLVSIVDVGALAAFTLLHCSVVGYFVVRRKGVARMAHRIVPIAGAAVTIAVLLAASSLAKIVALVWLAAGVLVLVWRGVDGRSYRGAAVRRP
jgi:amino acid transporter